MTAYPGSVKYEAVGDVSTHDALIEQLHRVHRELTEMLALAVQTPAGESSDAALSCLHIEANALARKFLELSESLLASVDNSPNWDAVESVPND